MTRTSFARTLVMAAAVATFAVAVPAGVPGTRANASILAGACTPGSDWGTSRQDLAARVVDLVNQHRVSRGLAQLTWSATLASAADWKSRHMAEHRYLAHDDPAPPVARTTGNRFLACGYPAGSAGWGENIASRYSTADAVLRAWLRSPGHRANIESASFRSIGASAAASRTGKLYWTLTFGRLRDSGEYHAPARSPAASARTAVPSSMSVDRGSVQGGSVTSLRADDNRFFELASTGNDTVLQARISGVSNALGNLRVVYRGMSSATCAQTISIRNWRRGSWTSLGRRPLGTRELEVSVTPTGTLADYVRGSTGNGDVDIRVRCNGGSSSFVGSADLLTLSYTT